MDVIALERTDQVDHDLIVAAQRRDSAAWDALVRRHDRWVRGIVYAQLGNPAQLDDVVQHVWMRVWQQIETLVDPARWRGWLYSLAKNAAIDAGKKAARHRGRHNGFDPDAWSRSTQPEPAKSLMARERHDRVLAAINGLPAIYREPFMLKHLENWSYRQIADAMSLPVDTVETRLVRARRLLRSALQRDGWNGSEEP